jgi:hypothetical protein
MSKSTLINLVSLQNKLHLCLNNYLNAGKLNKVIIDEIKQFLNYDFTEPLDVIVSGFQLLNNSIKIDDSKKIKVSYLQKYEEWEKNNHDINYLKPIIKFKNCIKKNAHIFAFAGFHGSFSTKDYIKYFSDLDTILVLKKEVVLDKKMLLKAKNVISKLVLYQYQQCVFQHHGNHIITEIDLKFYPNIYFPAVIFRYTTAILGGYIEINLRDDKKERIENINNWLNYFENFIKINFKSLSLYELIHYNQSVLLLPSLIYGLKYEDIYKKYSFEKINSITNEYSAIKAAELIRKSIKVII